MAKLTKANEYGQLELNQVAFRRDGRIIAQYKLDPAVNEETGELVIPYVENGMLLAIDYVNKTIKYPTAGQTSEIALNYTTEHMYDERLVHSLKHFKLDNGSFLPRLGLLAAGDRFTTNTVEYEISAEGPIESLDDLKTAVANGEIYGHASTNGYITANKTSTNAILKAIEFTTMPDGSDAIKFVAL